MGDAHAESLRRREATTAILGSLGLAGLPVGLQIVGPYLEDRTTIEFVARLAEAIGGYTPPPGV